MTRRQRDALLDRIDEARVELSGQIVALNEARDLLLIHERAAEDYPPIIRRARAIVKHAQKRIRS